MKNFTKQFANKTLLKPTRWLLVALMFLLGTASAWAYNQSAVDLYFDDSEAKWSDNSKSPYVYIGHGSWTACYGPFTRVSGTQYLFKLAKANFNNGGTWNGASAWVICNEKWWDTSGESIDKFTWHGDKNVTQKRTSAWSASYIYKTNGTASTTSDNHTIQAYKTTTVSNSNYTVTINSATGGTLTVKDYDDNAVSNGASKIYLTVLKFSASASTGYTFKEVQINNGSSTTTISAADLASQTYTITSNVTITPVWTANQYTITYKDKGNVTFSGTHATGYPTKHTYGTATTLKTASKTGYTFGGWFTTSACTGNPVTSLGATAYTSNITLYAQWQVACSLPSSISISGETNPCAESTQTYTANITGGADYDLVWTFPEGCTKTNETNNSITLTIGNASGNIICTAKCSESSTKASEPLAITVKTAPAVPTLSADNTSLIDGDKAVFTVGNTVSDLTYTLYNGNTPGESQVSNGSGLTFKAGDAGSYTVKVTNTCGTSTSTPAVVITVCTPQTNEFRHANSSYAQLQAQPTYYPGDKAYFVSTIDCCLTGTWSNNLQKGEEGWWTGLTGKTPKFSMTLTRAGEFTITNMANNGCTDTKDVKVNLDFTVTALAEVTDAEGTASGADIALTWKHSANHTKVMVVRYPTAGTETIPAGGQSYSAGNTLGEGTVVYVGTSESYTDKSLPSGESYKYYFYTVNNNYYSDGVVLNMSSCPIPAKPNLSSTAITACNGECTAQGYITINNMNDYKDDTYTFKLGSSVVTPDENGRLGINSTAYTQYTVTVTNSCGNPNSATVDIAINDNKPTITGNNSFQPGGSTTLISDKGASTTWVALDGGDLNTRTGASVVFTAKENGTYHVQATYNDCSTTITIKVQDDLYVWVRRPIEKEKAYDKFYANTTTKGGALYYKEFASKPANATDCNQGGKVADKTCEDKDGYTWDGFVISKNAIENNYYFTVHAANESSKSSNDTHTYLTQFNSPDADLYFVMDETGTGNINGWNINTPVVVRASGDAKFNSDNFADFVPLYVKDANICGKEVVSFEWQKSASQNGTYTTYKSGKGINNIRTREAGWYRCVVTYGDGKGTATSNAIQVTNTTSGTPGTLADFSSKLPVIMVNTNGVGFPSDKNLAAKNTKCASGKRYPSLYADDLKEKVTVDVIIKKGNEIIYDRKARMNYRGSSSLNFKKKSYAFCSAQDSCVFDKGRHDYVKTKKAKMLNILGLDYAANDKDWVLYAATPDPSMMRNRLVFDLYQQMRPNDWGVHSTYVELIVDGEYRGVYVFMDKITANEKRVNITNENGFIVKFDKTDVVDRVENAEGDQKTFATSRTGTKSNENGIESYGACIDQRFEIEYPEKEDIEDAGGNWEAFYTKVQKRFEDFETALAAQKYDEVRTIIDYDSWADWFIISEFIKNQDGFRASNLFVYNGGKIMAMPLWDQELSMDNRTRIAHGSNSTEGLLTKTASVYSDAFPATFWFTGGGANITGGLLNDPCFVSLVKEKWASYQLGALSASNITTLVNKYHDELDDNIRKREETKWPYTEASRGKTTDGDYMGYYAEGDETHYNYQTSKQAIIDFAGGRSTELGASTKGLGQALYGLNGKALIFTISPSLIETTPWQPSIFTVNAPEGYVYTLDYSELTEADAIIKENGNVYTFKIPRPNDWGTGGNGEEKSVNYRVTATIDADGENSCGTQHANTATLNVEFSDVTEDCETPIEPQP